MSCRSSVSKRSTSENSCAEKNLSKSDNMIAQETEESNWRQRSQIAMHYRNVSCLKQLNSRLLRALSNKWLLTRSLVKYQGVFLSLKDFQNNHDKGELKFDLLLSDAGGSQTIGLLGAASLCSQTACLCPTRNPDQSPGPRHSKWLQHRMKYGRTEMTL